MALAPGDTLGRFRIEEQIGRGGMATVYRALQTGLDRQVALKVLPDYAAADEQFQERFQREAVMVANLRHPNILTIYDFGTDGGYTFLVTELVDGGTLADRLGRPLPVSEVVSLLGPIAAALDHAHHRGIVHRDVKPSNILMTRDGRPVLADFGIARMLATTSRLTLMRGVIGTPAYMAPEQARGRDIGPAADRYALGVVAYEMLTGTVPFTADTPQAVLYAQVHQPLPPPRTVNPDLLPAVEAVLLRILAKAPDRRYPTTGTFIAALAVAGRDDDRRSRPPTPPPTPPPADPAGSTWGAGSQPNPWPPHQSPPPSLAASPWSPPYGPQPRGQPAGGQHGPGPAPGGGQHGAGQGIYIGKSVGTGQPGSPAGPFLAQPSPAPSAPRRGSRIRLLIGLTGLGLLAAGGAIGGRSAFSDRLPTLDELADLVRGEVGQAPTPAPGATPTATAAVAGASTLPPATPAPPTATPAPPTPTPAPPTNTPQPPTPTPELPTATPLPPPPEVAGWSRLGSQTATWNVAPNGRVTAHTADGNAMLLGPNSYADVEIESDASTTNREASLAVRVRDARNFYLFIFIPDGVPILQGRAGGLWLYKEVDGAGSFLGNSRLPGFVQAGDTVRLSLGAQGSTLIAKVNGREVLRADDATHPDGRAGLRIFGAQDSPCDSTFANVRVTPS